MPELVIQSGKLQGKRLVLPAKQMVVGRDEDCDLRIGSALVSRKHCVLQNTPEGILVTDLGSQNGTYVNDIPITGPTILREGDILRIQDVCAGLQYADQAQIPRDSQEQRREDLGSRNRRLANRRGLALLRNGHGSPSFVYPALI